MKLYRLVGDFSQYEYSYDVNRAVVVLADNKMQARELASEEAKDEGKEIWLDPEKSSCVDITQEDSPQVICVNAKSG